MCFFKTPKPPAPPQMPAQRQPLQEPKDNAVAAADRTKDRLRAGSNMVLTGPGGASNANTFKQSILGG